MSQPGKRNLITDIAGLRVGQAHDADAMTGTTAIICDTPSVGAVAVGEELGQQRLQGLGGLLELGALLATTQQSEATHELIQSDHVGLF